ncbi:MAG: Holliday junction resolvase RuvX [Gemmataceae bacterium]
MSETFPAIGRLMAVDVGRVRVGLAICDAARTLASPYETYTRRSTEKDAAHFLKLCQTEVVAGWVVGLPIHVNGTEGEKARESREYGAWLQQISSRPVLFWDERFTTALAEELLWNAGLSHKQRKERRDALAAQFILHAYIEAGCPAAGS